MKHIVDRELFCQCGDCERKVQEILRLEATLCHGARSQLARRRNEIRRERERGNWRAYKRRKKEAV